MAELERLQVLMTRAKLMEAHYDMNMLGILFYFILVPEAAGISSRPNVKD